MIVYCTDDGIIVSRPLYQPDVNHTWQAVRDSYDYGDPIGFGQSQGAAIADLLSGRRMEGVVSRRCIPLALLLCAPVWIAIAFIVLP